MPDPSRVSRAVPHGRESGPTLVPHRMFSGTLRYAEHPQARPGNTSDTHPACIRRCSPPPPQACGVFFYAFPKAHLPLFPQPAGKAPSSPLFFCPLLTPGEETGKAPGPDLCAPSDVHGSPVSRRQSFLRRTMFPMPSGDGEPLRKKRIKKEHVKKRALFPLSKENFLPGSPGGLQKRPFPALTADRPLFRATSWRQPERWRT